MAPSAKNMSKQLGSKILNVVVGSGEHKREFAVHEDLITECSEFFRSAMNGNWKESDSRVIPLEEEDPDVFAMYLQAIYAGNIPFEKWTNTDDEDRGSILILWVSLYALAEKLMDEGVKAVVLRACYDIKSSIWDFNEVSGDAIAIIYESTPGRCGIRQLLVDAAVDTRVTNTLSTFRTALTKVPVEFLEDMACGVATKLPARYTDTRGECRCKPRRGSWGAVSVWGDISGHNCNCEPIPKWKHHGLDYYLHWVDPEKPTVQYVYPQESLSDYSDGEV